MTKPLPYEDASFEGILNSFDTTGYSLRSLLLMPLVYVPVRWATRKLLCGKRSRILPNPQREILGEVLSGPVLLGRKLIMAARKRVPPKE